MTVKSRILLNLAIVWPTTFQWAQRPACNSDSAECIPMSQLYSVKSPGTQLNDLLTPPLWLYYRNSRGSIQKSASRTYLQSSTPTTSWLRTDGLSFHYQSSFFRTMPQLTIPLCHLPATPSLFHVACSAFYTPKICMCLYGMSIHR